jgi:tripartite-type tricarboxylate transporter receptor subunit TctC
MAGFSWWWKSMIPAWHRVLAACLALAAGQAYAQGYPSHAVRLVVPYGPGSSPDSVGRVVAREMQEALGQPVIVANVAGALANVGTAEVARAAPDGYTLLLTTNTPHAANVALFKSLPFDPVKDFAPIVRLITTSMVLLVRSDFPASTLKDFIAHARSKPNGLSAGYGSAATIVSIAKLRTAGGFKTLDVPYKGVPLAITDVLSGQVDFTLGDLAVSMPQIHGGKMKGLGVTSPQRSPLAPDLQAIAETFPGFETRIWYGLVAPANTPKAVVAKVHDVVSTSLAKPEVKARLAGLGLEPAPMPPEEFAAFIKQEIAKWTKEIREAGIQPE